MNEYIGKGVTRGVCLMVATSSHDDRDHDDDDDGVRWVMNSYQ